MADEILGFLPRQKYVPDIDPAAEDLIRQRDQARRAKNFPLADQLRDQLIAKGYEVLDGPEGTRIRRMGRDEQGAKS
jgi:cysteinyl-tRNA synthetase